MIILTSRSVNHPLGRHLDLVCEGDGGIMKNPVNEMTRQINPSMRKSHCLFGSHVHGQLSCRYVTAATEFYAPSSLSSDTPHLKQSNGEERRDEGGHSQADPEKA